MFHLSNHYHTAEWLFKEAGGFTGSGPCLPPDLHLVPRVPWLTILQKHRSIPQVHLPPPLTSSVYCSLCWVLPCLSSWFSSWCLGFHLKCLFLIDIYSDHLVDVHTVDSLSLLLLSILSPTLFPLQCLLLLAIILLTCLPHWHMILHEGQDLVNPAGYYTAPTLALFKAFPVA